MERIRATEVLFGSDDETHWVQWLWPHGGIDFEQGYFVVERAAEPDEGDSDTVWASRCGQGYSCYNGIEQAALCRREITIRMNQRGRNHLGCDDLTIEFVLTDAEFAKLADVLQQVFAGLEQLEVIAEPDAAPDAGRT